MKAEKNGGGTPHRKNHKNRKGGGEAALFFTVFTPEPAPTTPPRGRHYDCPGDALNKAEMALANTRHRPDEALKKLEVAPACHDASSG